MVGISGEQYDGGAGYYVFKNGVIILKTSDDTPENYIGTSNPTEDQPSDVNSDE